MMFRILFLIILLCSSCKSYNHIDKAECSPRNLSITFKNYESFPVPYKNTLQFWTNIEIVKLGMYSDSNRFKIVNLSSLAEDKLNLEICTNNLDYLLIESRLNVPFKGTKIYVSRIKIMELEKKDYKIIFDFKNKSKNSFFTAFNIFQTVLLPASIISFFYGFYPEEVFEYEN